MIIPPSLVKGDCVALVSPAYSVAGEDILHAADVLKSWGLNPVIGKNAAKTFMQEYSGTDDQRAEDLLEALRNTEIKAIICTRGGYGTLHLMDFLSPEDFLSNPKWLVGFSDISTLLSMSVSAGVACIHGPMGRFLSANDDSSEALRKLLFGTIPEYSTQAHPLNRPGCAEGILIGGNLSTIVPLLDTWADCTLTPGFILFLEEVEEDFRHIDRLIQQLRLHGVFSRCSGVILGQFTDCKPMYGLQSAEEIILPYLEGIPVLCGFPAGHDSVNYPLVFGSEVRIEVSAFTASTSSRVAPRRASTTFMM